jgi:hypothetical protein
MHEEASTMLIHCPTGPFRQYWLPAAPDLGVGVTACTLAEAEVLAQGALQFLAPGSALTGEILEDVDASTLDAERVLPRMGATCVHGVWYPRVG